MRDRPQSARQERAVLAAQLRSEGKNWTEVAKVIRQRYKVTALVAFRLAHGLSQQNVIDIWNDLWPDRRPKTARNLSTWERWPNKSGHEPSLTTLSRLAQIYQCSVSDLLTSWADYRHLDDARDIENESSGANAESGSALLAGRGYGDKSLKRRDLDEDERLIALATAINGAARVDADYVQAVRESSQHFISLDGLYGGSAIFPLAIRVFRAAHGKLGSASLCGEIQHGLESATGEVGQVAAWLAYDADKQSISRQIIHEALLISRLAGDRNAELFAMDHLTMQALYLHQPREAMRVLNNIDDRRISKRIVALFDIRRGRALAQYHDKERAFDALDKARSALSDSITPEDPPWTWWIDEAEVAWHRAMAHADLDEWHSAVPLFKEATDLRARNHRDRGAQYRRASYNDAVHLLDGLIRVKAWMDAEQVMICAVMPNVAEINSMRTTNLLLQIVDRIERSRNSASSTLLDSASNLRRFLK